MNQAATRVLELLTYIEEVEKLKTKPTFILPTEYFVAYQHELKGLPGVQFNVDVGGGEVWLTIPRLKEIPPPGMSVALKPWVTLSRSPEKLPDLKTEHIRIEDEAVAYREQLVDHPEIKEMFDHYFRLSWTPWAEAEKPRRKTIARYNQLFNLQQSLSSDGNEAPLELVWGVGFAVWKNPEFKTAVQHPLILQSCELSLNTDTFDIEIRPREVDARLETECYSEMGLPGVRHLDASWKAALANSDMRPNPFEASTFDGVLRAAVGHLDPTGTYEIRVHDVTPPEPGESLKITNTWVLFARKRKGDVLLDDIQRLKQNIERKPELPSVISSLVETGDSVVRVQPEQSFRGLSSSSPAAGSFELYFPMPYNDEQVAIIQKLENNDGVVVQGPPGTGKTHTIANVISHYLANGKRVLVTAKGESALAVLQEKLPERIRPLSVSLLSDERDGMKQFEHAIQTISSEVNALSPNQVTRLIEGAQAKLDQLHAQIGQVDQTVSAYAEKHMRNYTFQGQEVSPETMAKLVIADAELHKWFDDTPPPTTDGKISVDDADISAMRRARIQVAGDLDYLFSSLPSPDDFPTWPDLVGLHRDLVRARTIDSQVNTGAVLALVDSTVETFRKALELLQLVAERQALRAKLRSTGEAWKEPLGTRLSEVADDDAVTGTLKQICTDVLALESARRALLP